MSQSKSVAVEVTNPLSDEERDDLYRLELRIEKAVFEAGKALAEIRERELYRETHTNFDSYCRERFKMTRDSAYLKMAAAQVYENIRVSLPTNCRQQNDPIPLPTNENQVRYIAKAKLEPRQQAEVWALAVEEAQGKRPSGNLVKKVVEKLHPRPKMPNPWRVGEAATILVKGDPELKGRKGQWCIIVEVFEFSCMVQMWDSIIQVKPENLKELYYSPAQREELRCMADRLTALPLDSYDKPVLMFLEGLGKINRPFLNPTEDGILSLLESKN